MLKFALNFLILLSVGGAALAHDLPSEGDQGDAGDLSRVGDWQANPEDPRPLAIWIMIKDCEEIVDAAMLAAALDAKKLCECAIAKAFQDVPAGKLASLVTESEADAFIETMETLVCEVASECVVEHWPTPP